MKKYNIVNKDQLNADLKSVADKIREKSETSGVMTFPDGFVSRIDQCISLNFTVVGGTSAPYNPKENTIWVNTSTNITDWVFSESQPTAATGRVWIKTGNSGSVYFNSLKKNCINVYPLAAKQYVSGAWVDKTVRIYQEGAWKDFVTYYYNGENSGWSVCKPSSNGGWVTGTLTFDNAMVLETSNSGQIIVISDNKYNLSNVKKITFEIDPNSVFDNLKYAYVGITTTKSWATWNPGDGNVRPPSSYANAYAQITNSGKIELDVSAFTGEYYLFVCHINKQKIICTQVYS